MVRDYSALVVQFCSALDTRKLVDEGVTECKITAQLLPNWDGPAVECGIMLANIDEYDGALRELEQARATLPEETPHLRFVTGYVLMMLERYAEALDQLEVVTEAQAGFRVCPSLCRPVRFQDWRQEQGSPPRQGRPPVERLLGVDGLAGRSVFLAQKRLDWNTPKWITDFSDLVHDEAGAGSGPRRST